MTTYLRLLQAEKASKKWLNFAASVLPAPIIGAICPGNMAFKGIVTASLGAAQAAYYLAIAEYTLANAVDAVLLHPCLLRFLYVMNTSPNIFLQVSVKARAAAVADTYANQGARAGSILPFTSALAGLCAAASAAATELLPFINSVALDSLISMFFPSGAALFAAAASISKVISLDFSIQNSA